MKVVVSAAGALSLLAGALQPEPSYASQSAPGRDVYRQAKTQTSRPGALAYTYDSNMEMATIYPRGQQAASPAPSAAANVERFLGN